jgi:hypothetical protein
MFFMSVSNRYLRVAVSAALFSLVASASWAQERWFHVHVTEGGTDPVTVSVNLPLSLIEKAVKLVPAEVEEEVRMELNDVDINLDDLRDFWREVRETPDATFVTVQSEDETVRVAKEGEFLIARTVELREGGAEVDVRFPFSVLDAMFSGDENELDLVAAIRALAEYGDGDMVTVSEGETRVRVWVDDINAPAL